MFLLSGLVREHGYKVVLTGEGADEILAGYDIFKEMKIRRFVAKDPNSSLRPLLFKKLYPDIPRLQDSTGFLMAFFQRRLLETESPYYSHLIRWENTARTQRFFKNQKMMVGITKNLFFPQDLIAGQVWLRLNSLRLQLFFHHIFSHPREIGRQWLILSRVAFRFSTIAWSNFAINCQTITN